jgi:hypothetical protein
VPPFKLRHARLKVRKCIHFFQSQFF